MKTRLLTEADIIYQDNHLLVVDKPAGIPVQPDESGDISVAERVEQYIKIKYEKPGAVYLGVVHRIDRPVSGLLMFAKTSKAAARLSEMFRDRTIQKTYLAIVERQPAQHSAKLIDYIWKDKDANRAYCYKKEKKGSKKAELDYRLLQEVNGAYLLEVKPHTGRPHQIRAQLANIGCPIVGDTKYGSKIPLNDRSICLHARRLEFVHPVKKEPIEILSRNPDGRYWKKFNFSGI